MLRNLGGAVGTATLATVLTKREQFHSNIIGQSVTLYRDEVRQRIDQTQILHGAWRGRSRRRAPPGDCGDRRAVPAQALVMGFSDTFAVIGIVLSLAAVAIMLFARKIQAGGAGGGAH